MIESLCRTCKHVREIQSPRGSRFLLCRLSQEDPRFAKYPPQPIVKCLGYEERVPFGTGTNDAEEAGR